MGGQMRVAEFVCEQELDEGWRETLTNLGLVSFIAGAGTAGLTVKQALENPNISNTKKAVIAAKADIPVSQLPQTVAAQIPTAKEIIARTPELSKPDIKAPASTPSVRPLDIKPLTSEPNEIILKNYAKAAGIVGVELAALLAQCAHETLNFKELVEKASGDAYEPVFKKDKKSKKIIVDIKTGKPINFNNLALKLGNTQTGDGARFKGRGFIQLTGRYNYKIASQAIFNDDRLLKQPELAANPQIAAKIAVWYWKNRVQTKVGDFRDVKAVTLPINAGLAGIESRTRFFDRYINSARTT
jgi:predicted chitinase